MLRQIAILLLLVVTASASVGAQEEMPTLEPTATQKEPAPILEPTTVPTATVDASPSQLRARAEQFVTWGGWLGIAGLAQIFAAVLSLVVVVQADRQRRESVAPDLQLTNVSSRSVDPKVEHTGPWDEVETELAFENIGFGPAKDMRVDLHPDEKTRLRLLHVEGIGHGIVGVGSTFRVSSVGTAPTRRQEPWL